MNYNAYIVYCLLVTSIFYVKQKSDPTLVVSMRDIWNIFLSEKAKIQYYLLSIGTNVRKLFHIYTSITHR